MDETEKKQDTSQKEDTSAETKGTSEKEPEPITKKDVEKAVSDALSAAGRDAKTITEKTAEAERILQNAKRIGDEAKERQKKRDEAAREAVRDDPDALKSLEEKQRQRDEAAKLVNERAELDADKESVKADKEQVRVQKRTQLAAEVAVEKGVNMDALIKLTQEDSREAMEATAELLPKTGETKPPLKTDSGTTTGGEKSPEQKLKDRYPTMK